jgi:medium-chain acyl-[acyl-carrier-protein] hydrolase
MGTNASSDPWSVCFNPQRSASLRLICFAHAGGGAGAFSTWHRQLPPQIELCAVQLPGRDLRRKEPFVLDMERLVEQLHVALAPLHDLPVALFGYSLGGLVAFEYARALRRAKRPGPTQLIVCAARAPQQPADPAIHKLAQADFIREMGSRYDGIPRAVLDDPELLAYFLPVIRADLTLLASYRYRDEPPLACPITAFGGRDDHRITPKEIGFWTQQTSGAFGSRIFPGGHFFITSARDQVLGALVETLTAAAGTSNAVETRALS